MKRNPNYIFLSILSLIFTTLSMAAQPDIRAAIARGDKEAVEKMLKADRNGDLIDSLDDDGERPIHLASRLGKLTMVRLLVENGADCNLAHEKTCMTALHYAVDHSDIVDYLMMHGAASPHAVDVNQRTPLHTAAANKCEKSYQILMAWGAREDVVDKKGSTPLSLKR